MEKDRDQGEEKKQTNEGEEKKVLTEGKKQMINSLIEQKKKKNPDRKKVNYWNQLLRAHQYWDKRPTLRDDVQQHPGNVEGQRQVKDVPKQPVNLPSQQLFWCDIDVKDEKQLDEFYFLLTNNYVEDEDNTYRFDYSRGFLQWALTPPGYRPEWLVGVRDAQKRLVASITGVPVLVNVEKDKIKMAEINFLCVHKDCRKYRLASYLISQVTRRVNLRDKWQAIYTSGKTLPTPFCRATYYHRSLNPKKLIEVRFSALGPNQTLPMVKKLYALPQEVTLPQLRPMNKNDVFYVTKLINQGLSKYVVKFQFTEQEVRHYFLPRDKIIYSYVLSYTQVQNNKKKEVVTDFLSFYSLPSHVMNNPKHNMLYACYSYYNFATTVPFKQLIKNALILSRKQGFDVYNCLNLMENQTVYEDLHFQVGDGNLNYYIYNWVMNRKHIDPNELAVVLF